MLHSPADPPLLFLRADAEVVLALVQYFTTCTTHTSRDGIDALAFLVFDLGGFSSDLMETAAMADTILTSCYETNPDSIAFDAWKDAHMLHDRKARFFRRHGEATPTTWWPVAYGCWILTPINARDATKAALAAQTFRSRGVPLEVALLTVRAFLGQPREAQNVFVELLQHRALLADDLRSPAEALAIMGHPDFMETVDLWRKSGRKQSLRTIAGSLLCERKHLTRRFKPRREAAKIIPPIAAPVVRDFVTTPLSLQPKIPAPTTLAEALQTHLPPKAQPMADHVAVALSVMKMDPRPWSMSAIITRVRNMMGAATRIADRLVEEAFQWLAKRGVVENVGGYRLRDTTDDAIGLQILGMVR